MRRTTRDVALLAGLEAAVPLWIAELARASPAERSQRVNTWAREAAEAVAHRGDILQFGGRRGEAAKVFNQLARGLAAAAHGPGGVCFGGRHWCLDHPSGVAADNRATCHSKGLGDGDL